MTKNPFYNSLAALVYIVLVVFVMNVVSSEVQTEYGEYIMPILILSLFTLSTAVMGYIFGYRPLTMYLDGKKKEAVKLFIKTVLIFGVMTFSLVLIYYFLVLL